MGKIGVEELCVQSHQQEQVFLYRETVGTPAALMLCLDNVPVFNYFGEKPNCPTESMGKNASAYFDVTFRYLTIRVLTDTSVTDALYFRKQCIKKENILVVVEGWITCFKRSERDRLPVLCVQDLVMFVLKAMNLAAKVGIHKNFIGQ